MSVKLSPLFVITSTWTIQSVYQVQISSVLRNVQGESQKLEIKKYS